MSGPRSITLGTNDLSKTKELLNHIIGLQHSTKNGRAIRFGDANLSPGTCIHFVEVPEEDYKNLHISSVRLRTLSDSGLVEYQNTSDKFSISYSSITELNGLEHFTFEDHNQQKLDIYSNELDTGIGLGMPTSDSPVNPLYQVQGLSPVIIKVNELSIITSILTQVLQLDLFAEYLPHEDARQPVQVFHIDEGGLGGEIHLFESDEDMQMNTHGPIEQVEFSTNDTQSYLQAKNRLDEIGVPYQTLEQDTSESLRITENSGISSIYTLEK